MADAWSHLLAWGSELRRVGDAVGLVLLLPALILSAWLYCRKRRQEKRRS